MINFSENYNRKNFQIFLKDFLPNDYVQQIDGIEIDEKNNYFQKINLLGFVKSLNNLVIIEAERKKPEKSRIVVAKELFKFLEENGYTNALVITYSDQESHYRFSLITSSLSWVSDTKVKKHFSNPKRLSFLLGPESKIHTATKHLIIEGKIKDFDDLHARFNIEIINDEFYEHYKNLFLNLMDKLDNDIKFSNFAKKINLKTSDFAKRLLSQIVFCYFLQKKGWLTKDTNTKFGEGENSFLRDKFKEYEEKKENFFNNFLEFFFYLGLNNQNKNHYVKEINCKVPYIGGGLFRYYEGYDWQKENLNIPNSTFSNKENNGILDVFDLYNFTVDENESVDIEISIDPEMLGKTFEKLLDIKDRKSSGTFYTPREIVKFMAEDSLISYLNDKKIHLVPEGLIVDFIKFENIENKNNQKLLKENAGYIDTLLREVKVCDPAVGTGAFVVEIVNLISRKRKKLDEYLGKVRNIYSLKLQSIKKSIYGVDIESHAIEIAKLRLWLSLIIDEKNYEKINALPNLNFKFIVGNSLFQSSQLNLFDFPIYEKIQKLKDEFLITTSYTKQKKLSKDIEGLYLDLNQNKESFDFSKNFSEVFSDKKKDSRGFDIVIGNPPYVRGDTDKNDLETKSENALYKLLYKEVHGGGRTDLYIYFIKKAEEICKKNGIISYIISNKWMTTNYGKNLRVYLSSKQIDKIIDFGDLPIFEAVVCPNILVIKNNSNKIKIQNTKCLDAATIIKNFMSNSNQPITVKSIKRYLTGIGEIFENTNVKFNNFPSDGSSWTVNSSVQSENFLKAKKILKDTFKSKVLTIRGGVKTGFNKAFIINQSELNDFLKQDKNCNKFIKPFLKGRNIKPWKQDSYSEYIIFADRDFDISNCPLPISKHLKKFKNELSERATVPGSHPWYQLQQPQIGFINDYENSIKLVWRDISNRSVTTLVDKGIYLDMTCFYIPINDRALCSWMHSDFYFKQLKTISSIVRGDAIRWKKQWVQQTYFYPKELQKDLEKIYDLSINNPKDGIKKLNELVNKFIK
jgi:type I restriction-modification system DNA methylase subunit